MLPPICPEATNFIRACEAIHGLVAHDRLSADDRELILFSGNELMTRLID